MKPFPVEQASPLLPSYVIITKLVLMMLPSGPEAENSASSMTGSIMTAIQISGYAARLKKYTKAPSNFNFQPIYFNRRKHRFPLPLRLLIEGDIHLPT